MKTLKLLSLPAFAFSLLLNGCALQQTAPTSTQLGPAISGKVFGGSQPITGAQLYLFTPNPAAYGGNGIAPSTSNASISLLTQTSVSANPNGGGTSSLGAYVNTNSTTGGFKLTGDYDCTAGGTLSGSEPVYLYALGGNPGGGVANALIGLMAALGPCNAPYSQTITLNEATTVAAAYALSGFATDATHIGYSGTTLAQQGLANAFLGAANITALSTGAPQATPAAGNGTVPQQEINTLADILASCVDGSGTLSGPSNPSNCYTLFYNARSAGTTGTIPSDTATAAINIAHNPAATVSTLFALQGSTGAPFAPTLSTKPNDFTIAIQFTGGTLDEPGFIAVDASGNIWVPNLTATGVFNVVELNPSGAIVSPASGYLSVPMGDQPDGIAIDKSGCIWLANSGGSKSTISKLNPDGTAFPGSPFSGGGLNNPRSIAFDGHGDVFIANAGVDISEFNGSTGAPISSTGYSIPGGHINLAEIAVDPGGKVWYSGYEDNINDIYSLSISGSTGTNTSFPATSGDGPVAIDSAGNIWVAGSNGTTSKLSNVGSPAPGSPFSGGGQCSDCANSIAIDGAGDVWIANGPFEGQAAQSISELNNSGATLSPSTGFQTSLLNYALGIAVDGSGNLWAGDGNGPDVVEFIGAATPVITPIAAGLPTTPNSTGLSNLGTRP